MANPIRISDDENNKQKIKEQETILKELYGMGELLKDSTEMTERERKTYLTDLETAVFNERTIALLY